jgi:hypothetical protein
LSHPGPEKSLKQRQIDTCTANTHIHDENLFLIYCTSASSTTKTGHHDIAEILLKVALNTINQIKSNQPNVMWSIVINICLLYLFL